VPGQTQEPGPARTPSAGPSRPSPRPAGKTVLLRYGDTLYGLAGHHGTTVKALQRLNGLGSSTFIYAGDTLRVPAARDAATETGSVREIGQHLFTRSGVTWSALLNRNAHEFGQHGYF
jgi:LysM repeat protein